MYNLDIVHKRAAPRGDITAACDSDIDRRTRRRCVMQRPQLQILGHMLRHHAVMRGAVPGRGSSFGPGQKKRAQFVPGQLTRRDLWMQFPGRDDALTYYTPIRYGVRVHLGDETCTQRFLGPPVSGATNCAATMLTFLPHLSPEVRLSASCTRMRRAGFVSTLLRAVDGNHCHRRRDEKGTRLSMWATASPHSVPLPSYWINGPCSFWEELANEVGVSQWLKPQENRSIDFGESRGLIQLESSWPCRPGSHLTSDSHPGWPPSRGTRSSPKENKNQNRNSHRVTSREHRWVSFR